jgi:hypothetical protein
VILECTHHRALEFVSLEDLQRHAYRPERPHKTNGAS